ncbi:aminopeptidase Ey-like [Drosophila kikkawai]|uniref:Aminopeptidase n=1 Tax=Drosophila kikkawai TaxID=30033 RepID=A0A6P4IMG2_DROKI|nr:aminopeptidase Ey-like [Drosophila kikkawai]
MNWVLLFALILFLGFATTSSDLNYNYYRLPAALRPQKYHLNILTLLDNPEESRFNGTVKILIEVLDNTKNITLHSKDLIIDESQTTLTHVNSGEKKDNCVSSTAVNPAHDYYILNTCQELLPGNIYELNLYFSADLKTQLEGYYRSSYEDAVANETRWITITQFEPASARLAFPCFDEPNYKAPFVVTLGHHKKFTSLSNMPVKETKPHESLTDYVWTEFEESVPMSTYLVAYSINDFSHKPSTLPNGVPFRTWARPNAIDQCDYTAEFGPKVLQYYEELFGIKFPLPKIDQFAVPDFEYGAMENWGLVVYSETTLLVSETHSSLNSKMNVAGAVAHELAHQWFGNLVTMKWWTDLWLNEGFATYVASLGVAQIHPELDYLEMDFFQNLHTIFQRDAMESSHPISRPIQTVKEINENFDDISYEKGSSVIRMMHLFLGDETFRSGLKTYLRRYKYKNAEQDNLWESLTQAAHENDALPKNYEVKTIMDSWTLQTGYPVINVTRDYASGTAELTQARYLLNSDVSRSHHEGCWWVPLSYTTQAKLDFNNTSPEDWLECSKEGRSQPKTINNLPGADQWVIFNTKLSAPYKVNYDSQNWKLLIETLNSEHFESIHVVNRAQLIEDVFSLAWTGEQDYETALGVMEYLHRERELLPLRAAFEKLTTLRRLVRRTPNFGYYKRYINKLIAPLYQELNGINDTFGSIQSQNVLLLKTELVDFACMTQVSDCVSRSKDYFREWRSVANPDETNPVPIEVRGTVYCTAIKHGSDEDWEFLWTRYLKTNVAADRDTILLSLTCTQNERLLQRQLDMIFDPKGDIRMQDAAATFDSVAANGEGWLLAKKYLVENLDHIYKYFYPVTASLAQLLPSLSDKVNTRQDYNEFKDFLDSSWEYLKDIKQAVQQTKENMLISVQWQERNYQQFFRAIRQKLNEVDEK